MDYDNFLVKLYKSSPSESRYQAQVLVPDSAGGGRFDLPLTAIELRELRKQSATLIPYARYGRVYQPGLGYVAAHETVRWLTQKLHDMLPLSLQRALRESLMRAQQRGRGLRIGVLIDRTAEELAALPWEMLWDPDWSGGYLAQSPAAPIVRLVATSAPPHLRQDQHDQLIRSNNGERFTLALSSQPAVPQRVLVVPVGAIAELRVAGATEEAELIQKALGARAVVEILPAPITLAHLEAELSAGPYQVLHIIAHGPGENSLPLSHLLFDQAATPGGDDAGESDQVSGQRLLAVLQGQPSLQLIVFNSCRSATVLEESNSSKQLSTNRGFLTNSLGSHVASGTGIAVVAMQFDIRAPAEVIAIDPTRSWASAFYTELGRGRSLEWALTAARRALNVDKDPVLWSAPTLFVPLRWAAPPLTLYERLDRRIYGGLAAAMEGDGQLLLEGTLIAGLILVAAPVMLNLLSLPGDADDSVALMRAALALFETVALLPAVIAGCVLVLAARSDPDVRAARGHLAFAFLYTAYAGAGLGMLTVLFGVGMLAFALHYVGPAYSLSGGLLQLLLQAFTIGGGVLQSMVSAGRFVRVAQSVGDSPQIYSLGLLIGFSPLILGAILALALPIWYGWLFSGPEILVLFGATLIAMALWVLRRAPGRAN